MRYCENGARLWIGQFNEIWTSRARSAAQCRCESLCGTCGQGAVAFHPDPLRDRVWCGRRELNPHGLAACGFSYHFGFRRPAGGGFVVWTIPSPLPKRGLGAARLVSTPSREYFRAWLGIAIAGFPDFEQFYAVGFPMGTQALLSPLRLPFRHARGNWPQAHHNAAGNDPHPASQADLWHTTGAAFGIDLAEMTEAQGAGARSGDSDYRRAGSSTPQHTKNRAISELTAPDERECFRRRGGIQPSKRRRHKSWSRLQRAGGA
jgi:hypothetical protein